MDAIHPLYILPRDPLGEEVLIPSFKVATSVDCMVGFFSSEVLASLAPGLATYIESSANSFRLIISPFIRKEDQVAIENGINSTSVVSAKIIDELKITKDLLQMHTLKCLTWLLREQRIEIKIALLKDALFHPKVWLFASHDDIVAAHGSSNVTFAGIQKNIEQIAISKSWQDPNQRYITDKLRAEFSRLWDDTHENCVVIDLPKAVHQHLLRTYSSATCPTEDEMRVLYSLATQGSKESDTFAKLIGEQIQFSVPNWLEYETGPFEHQGRAVSAWCDASFRGVLEMATGSGKTITSMISAYRLFEHSKPLLIVIAAPYIPLIEQWCDEIVLFGLKPLNLTTLGGVAQRSRELQRLRRRIQTGPSDIEVVVVSHDTLCSLEFLSAIEEFDSARLLIADEAHNLGRPSFINSPPQFFEHRLALSATPIRQYDEEGTEALFKYFGPVAFSFTLEEAIGRCLVPYDYYVHAVYLTKDEMDEWYELTGKIQQNTWRGEDDKHDEYLSKLLRDRTSRVRNSFRQNFCARKSPRC